MKKNYWYLYLFEDEEKTEIFKVMKFNTISEMSNCIQLKPKYLIKLFSRTHKTKRSFKILYDLSINPVMKFDLKINLYI